MNPDVTPSDPPSPDTPAGQPPTSIPPASEQPSPTRRSESAAASAVPAHEPFPACMRAARVWRDGHVLRDRITVDEIGPLVHDPDVLVWVDLVAPTEDELASLARRLSLPATAVEDALGPKERPKLARHDTHLCVTVYAVMPELSTPQHLEMTRISAWVIPSALITIRLNDHFDMDAVVHRWEEDPDLLKAGSGALVHGLLDAVVDDQFEWIEALDDRMEDLAGELFEQRHASAAFAKTIFDVRRELVTLRRIVLPMREVVAGLVRDPSMATPALRPWFDDLFDHVLRAAEWTESLRDLVGSAFETNLALNDERLNTIMKKLAGWAAIIALPTAITGWFGQNVPYPGFSQPLGLWLSIGLIVGCAGALYVVFKARDWL